MQYLWSKNIYDSDGDLVEECVLVYVGENTIIKFKDAEELAYFAKQIQSSLPEIKSV